LARASDSTELRTGPSATGSYLLNSGTDVDRRDHQHEQREHEHDAAGPHPPVAAGAAHGRVDQRDQRRTQRDAEPEADQLLAEPRPELLGREPVLVLAVEVRVDAERRS
jgi:hypothetical protein